jgi:alanyl-tRNA synthetase
MRTDDVIRTFIDFFEQRGHQQLTGTSLLPPPDDPVLFTTAGMHPLTPYLQGRPHPQGRRLVNVQRCLRTTDLDEVGDPFHLTVFEMLGSWSLGDYPGPQSLRWGYELLRDGFGLDPDHLHATVYGGDEVDTPSLETWRGLGVPVEVNVAENWWSNGPTGPCGPDSEIFVWTGDDPPTATPGTDERWVEVWNHVMMRYRRRDDGRLEPLPQSNIDTGMGLERLLTVLQKKHSVYECDIFEAWALPWDLDLRSSRVMIDHLRASLAVIGDGVRPSNTLRGYVLRRVIRRALTTLWRDDPARTLDDLPVEPIAHTREHYRQPVDVGELRGVLRAEERRVRDLRERGRVLVSRQLSRGPLTEADYHYLYDTHGLPRDLVDSLVRAG